MAHRVCYSLDGKCVNVQSVQFSLKFGQYALDMIRRCLPAEFISSSEILLV